MEIRRTSHGVPHVLAEDLGALGYGLAWTQLEDHGPRVLLELVRSRGELGTVFGRDSIGSDFVRRQFHDRAVATYDSLHRDTRDLEAGFAGAINEVKRAFGRWDVAWGDVHRVRIGAVDEPVGGCTGGYGCFRVLSYAPSTDSVRVANRGDGWVLAVEFGETPRAYSVLAYGQSSRAASPHRSDQAALFAHGQLKPVAFTEADIARQLVRRYRPGVR